MIQHQEKYEKYIKESGVGSNDNVADSCKSYISYLNCVQTHLQMTVDDKTLSTENDIVNISARLTDLNKLSAKTISNYGSAMKQYVRMIAAW
jgi:hypothetical protein